MLTIPLFSIALTVATCIPSAAAAGLDVNPVNTATFSLYIVLAVYTTFQAIRAYGILKRPAKEGEHVTHERIPYAKIFLATLTLITCYILEAIWIPTYLSKDNSGSEMNNIFYGTLVVDQLSDILIACALLHFIGHRRDVLWRQCESTMPASTHFIPSTKRLWDHALLAVMTVVTITGIIVGTVVTPVLSDPDLGYKIYTSLYHTYIALYVVVTLNITFSTWFLWQGLSASIASTEKITRVILKHIAPLLIVRVLFKLSVDIATSVSSTSFEINADVLGLVEAIVECFTYAAVLYMSLSLARPVQKELEEMREPLA